MASGAPSGEDGVSYAQEVYAACATVGFSDAKVTRLKRLLDEPKRDAAELLAAAQAAQLASIAWAGR